MFTTVFTLLIVFQAKHFLADFVIQLFRKDGMAKFNANGWVWPLTKHAGDHAILSGIITFFTLMYFQIDIQTVMIWSLICLSIDFVIHFTMDRIKASPSMLGRYKDMNNKPYWMCLGFDQTVHHLTHYAIIAMIIIQSGIKV